MTDRRSDDLSQMWQEGPVAHLRSAPGPAGRRRRAPQRRRLHDLALAGYAALGLVCLGLAGLTFLLVAAPVDFLRDRLIEQVKARTGRELVAAGPTSLSFFPRLAVSLRDVAVSAPEGMAGGPTLAIPSLDIELRFLSLLSRRPKVERVTLHQPTIELHVDADGRRSWDVAGAQSGRRRPAPAEASDPDRLPPAEPTAAKAAAMAADLGAQRVRIIGGTLRYRNETSGARYEVGSFDLDLDAVDPSGPLEINGAFDWRGVRLTFAGTATPASAVVAGQQARLVFNLTGPTLQARYEGRLALEAGLSLDGSIDIRAPSVRGLRTWLDQAVPEVSDGDALAFTARLVASDGRVTIASLEASLGEISMAGSLAVDTRPARAHVVGDLRVSALDVGTVLTRPGKRAGVPEKNPSPAGAAPAPPSLHGRAGGKGWSDQPLNLTVLSLVDADLSIAAGRLLYKEMSTGKAKLALQLKGGVGEVTLEDIELYGGRGRGVLTLDGTGKIPAVGTSLNLVGVSVQPLLADALGFKWLDGRGDVAIALSGQGLSERQVVDTLSGKVDVVIASGAMVGIDVAKIMRALPQGRLPSFAFKPEERTPFSEFSATFDIAGGKAKNHDLKIVSTHVQLAGDGVLDLGPRQINYTLRAKVSGGEIETGPILKIGSFEIPIGVEGPWENPVFTVKGQEQLTDMVKHLGKLLKSKEAQEALEGLIGGKRAKQRETLEKFLKKE